MGRCDKPGVGKKKEGTGMGRIPCLPGSLIRRNKATDIVDWKIGDNDAFPRF